MSDTQPQKKDFSLQTLGSIFLGATILRVGYEIYQIRHRVNKLENYMEQKDIPIISQKPIISTPEYLVISDVPKELKLNSEDISTITLFTKGLYEVVPNSLTINQIVKPDASKVDVSDLPSNDISQGKKTLQIPFQIKGLKKGRYSLSVDFSFQMKKSNSLSTQEIRRKVILPLVIVD